MGSGHGKGRRAQVVFHTARTTVPDTVDKPIVVVFDSQKWGGFLRSQKLTKQNLSQYYALRDGKGGAPVYDYHGDVQVPGDLFPDEVKEVSENLFADAVAVGAIVLPDPYNVEDFGFGSVRVHEGIAASTVVRDDSIYSVKMYRGDKPRVVYPVFSYTEGNAPFNEGTEMRDVLIPFCLEEICGAVKELVS
jgi:hypothetical protein